MGRYTNKYDTHGSVAIGEQGETLFEQVAKERGWTVIKATDTQNYKEHWDYALRQDNDVYYVDVKGLKRENRRAHQDDKKIPIELMGITGYPGWLYGKATHIAFLVKEGFVFVDRIKLVNKVEEIIDVNVDPVPSEREKRLHVIYRRVKYNRKDKIVYISKEELLSVPHKIWEVENV